LAPQHRNGGNSNKRNKNTQSEADKMTVLKMDTTKTGHPALTTVFIVTGAVLALTGFLLAFLVAPLVPGASVAEPAVVGGSLVSNKLLLSQKIFYWHVPVAVTSFVALAFTAFFGLRYLVTKNAAYDLRSRTATEVGLVFILATMASGDLWTRFEWGVWWVWEPRLTTYFILMLLVIAYFILRTAIDDPRRKATFAAVFGIITFIDVPICYLVTQLIPSSLHPVVFRTDSGLPPAMLLPFLLSLFGMLLFALGIYRLRLRQAGLAQRVSAAKRRLDELLEPELLEPAPSLSGLGEGK
jgi:heme exporter protein C